MVSREVLALMLRYVGAVCGVIYSILLPLMVHIMVVSTHSLFNTGRFVSQQSCARARNNCHSSVLLLCSVPPCPPAACLDCIACADG